MRATEILRPPEGSLIMLTASVLRSVSNVSSWASMLNFFSNSLGTSSLSVVKELAQRLCSSWRWMPAVLRRSTSGDIGVFLLHSRPSDRGSTSAQPRLQPRSSARNHVYIAPRLRHLSAGRLKGSPNPREFPSAARSRLHF